MKVNVHSPMNAELVAWHAAMVHEPEELAGMYDRFVKSFEAGDHSVQVMVWITILRTAIRLRACDVVFEEV